MQTGAVVVSNVKSTKKKPASPQDMKNGTYLWASVNDFYATMGNELRIKRGSLLIPETEGRIQYSGLL